MEINPVFIEEPENSTLQYILTTHNQNHRFVENSKYNLTQGSLLASDRSALKITLTNLPAGYNKESLHEIPATTMTDFTLTVFIAIKRSLAKRYPNVTLKGLVLFMDLKAPTAHVFFQQPKAQTATGMPASTSPKESIDEVRPHLHKKSKQQQKSKESKPSDEANSHRQQKMKDQLGHALHLQRQAMAQQSKAASKDEEKKKALSRKQREQRRLYQQNWWQKDDGLTR